MAEFQFSQNMQAQVNQHLLTLQRRADQLMEVFQKQTEVLTQREAKLWEWQSKLTQMEREQKNRSFHRNHNNNNNHYGGGNRENRFRDQRDQRDYRDNNNNNVNQGRVDRDRRDNRDYRGDRDNTHSHETSQDYRRSYERDYQHFNHHTRRSRDRSHSRKNDTFEAHSLSYTSSNAQHAPSTTTNTATVAQNLSSAYEEYDPSQPELNGTATYSTNPTSPTFRLPSEVSTTSPHGLNENECP